MGNEGKIILPQELLFDILLGLSTKSLLRFKSVCKNWHSLIGSSNFVTRYSRISDTRDSGKLICTRRDPIDKNSHFLSLVDCQTREKIVDLQWPPFLNEGVAEHEACERVIMILGPVNGIYCIFNRLVNREDGILVLWNPSTKEYKHLVPGARFPFSFDILHTKFLYNWFYELKAPIHLGTTIGFGSNNSTDDLEVVVIYQWESDYDETDETWLVRIYSLSLNSWRTTHYFRTTVTSPFEGWRRWFKPSSYPKYVHCYLNGVFHWSDGNQKILAFDMDNESFRLMKGPPLPDHEYSYQSVWVLKETLVMVFSTMEDNCYPSGAFVWMMTEYGVEDSWEILCSFGPTPGLTFLGIPNDKEIFFCDHNGQLISSMFDNQEFKEYGVYGMCDQRYITNMFGTQKVLRYVETLVRLKP